MNRVKSKIAEIEECLYLCNLSDFSFLCKAIIIQFFIFFLDAWTRVTSSLYICHMEYKYGPLTDGLEDALKNKVAQVAEEQDEIENGLFKTLLILLHKPHYFVSTFVAGFWLIVQEKFFPYNIILLVSFYFLSKILIKLEIFE